jgi:hypothetical protein
VAIEQLPASGWPTGQTQLLMLTHVRPEELAEKFGLVFEDDVDDLSYVKLAVVRGSFGIAGLMARDPAPFEGVLVYVDRDVDLVSVRAAVMSELGLTGSDISWDATDPT